MSIKKNEIPAGMEKKILIVEDEDALASILSAKFRLEGFAVLIADNGADGLRKIKEWRPDVILLDIVMPKMNGYEVLENLQKNNNKIPVIIISNSGQDIELEKVKKMGAADYIIKTQIEPGEVAQKVNKLLNISAAKTLKKTSPGGQAEANSGGAKVLLVEDDSFLRDICRKKLIKEGFNVEVAVDGEEALKKVENFMPEIVLLDIILPAMDGFEVLKKIRSHKNRLIKNVPVIILTNLGQEEDNRKALALGANDYLVKAHFTMEEIVKKVKDKLGMG